MAWSIVAVAVQPKRLFGCHQLESYRGLYVDWMHMHVQSTFYGQMPLFYCMRCGACVLQCICVCVQAQTPEMHRIALKNLTYIHIHSLNGCIDACISSREWIHFHADKNHIFFPLVCNVCVCVPSFFFLPDSVVMQLPNPIRLLKIIAKYILLLWLFHVFHKKYAP